jgi:hypothetical protein
VAKSWRWVRRELEQGTGYDLVMGSLGIITGSDLSHH